MAGDRSACPRDVSAAWQRIATAGHDLFDAARSAVTRHPQRRRRIMALAYAVAIAVGLAAGAEAHPLLLVASALMVAALAFRAPGTLAHAGETARKTTLPTETAPPQRLEPLAPVVARLQPAALPFLAPGTAADTAAGFGKLADRGFTLPPPVAASKGALTVPHGWSDLMARMSHELRTPLNAVIGFSDAMNAELLGPLGDPRYREYARHIRDCGREFLKSAEDALAITSLLGQQMARPANSVDLATLLTEAWHSARAEHGHQPVALDAQVPTGLHLVGERRSLKQILVNLLSEAVMRSLGGPVSLTVCVDGDLAQIEIAVAARGSSERAAEPSLAICMARALLELQGASLIEIDESTCAWRVITVLPCAAQTDFFATVERPAVPALQLC